MIPNTAALCQETRPEQMPKVQHTSSWQQALAQAIRDPQELLSILGLEQKALTDWITQTSDFPLRVPRSYVARMRPGDPNDPLLLQVLPRAAETATTPGFVSDPVGDKTATVSPGLLHKYQGRVLLVSTAACPVHCRYCFRRHFPYQDNHLDAKAWQQAIEYIAADSSIHEVILSGGDPLSLSNSRLAAISQKLSTIGHLKRLRIHTRMPIVLPERVDDGLLAWLENLPWQAVMVVHCNHPNEIDTSVRKVMARVKKAGVTLLNQAVLLNQVNHSVAVQIELSEVLFDAGILPYYLHLLDPVDGAAHFDVAESTAHQLVAALRRKLPGYLVPRLVRETPGMPSKSPVFQYS